MPDYRITPLTPAYVLMAGAVLILTVGPALAPRRRYDLAIAVTGLAVLSLFFTGSSYAADVHLVRVLAEWLDEPALALRVPPFEPFLWLLMLSLLGISLAQRGLADELASLDQAMLWALAGAACGVVLSSTYRTLAFTLLLFDATAALFALALARPGQAIGRLLLGVLSSAAVIAMAQGTDRLTAYPSDLGVAFSLLIWLRVGVYPLVESGTRLGAPLPMRLGWTVINLAVGLYLAAAGVDPWLAWLAAITALLHGALAWLESRRGQALAHVAHALAGGILALVAGVAGSPAFAAASIGILAAMVALELTPPRLGRPDVTQPQRWWGYVPPLLATATLVGIPFTLGWQGRGFLYQAAWEAGLPGLLAVVVLSEGAALAAIYQYWRRLLRGTPARAQSPPQSEEPLVAGGNAGPVTPVGGKSLREEPPQGSQMEPGRGEAWQVVGATLAGIPWLVPVIGPGLLAGTMPPGVLLPGVHTLSASLGLVGSLCWGLFLGYGRPRLLGAIPVARPRLMGVLRLGWLLRGLGRAVDTIARVVLRVRAVIEGEHYLAWAILFALGLGLVVLLS